VGEPESDLRGRLTRAEGEHDRWAQAYAEDVGELLEALHAGREATEEIQACLLDAWATASEWAGEAPADRMIGLLGRSLDGPDLEDGLEVRAGMAHASRREALVEIVRLTRELRRCDPAEGVVPVEDLREWARLVEEVAEEGLRPQPAPPPDPG
jgi:hypothetical protein